ncbi:MAG: helix-turn-helix domain-containing protein, partial [Candidatus Omnitrophica bacterium]|nr:helix-turn-helix domain-containing protein [Candidatus Omnitrophota bacterium]
MAREGIITMTQEELKRLHLVKKVLAKELKQIEAADKLGLSARQISRITKRVKEEGEKGIVHKSRGQISHN